MSNSLESSSLDWYYVSCNPLTNMFHAGSISVGSQVTSGQPFMVYKDSYNTVMDLVFSSYSVEGDIDPSFTPNVFDWSVYSDEAEIDSVVSTLNSFDFIIANKIKHPVNAEWAIPFNQAIFDSLPDGPEKTFLADKAATSVAEGRRFDSATMITNGWT